MTQTTEDKALALLNEARSERGYAPIDHLYRTNPDSEALCRAIEQHEAFRQEVSDAVEDYTDHLGVGELHFASKKLGQFIIPKPKPKPKPDPLVEIMEGLDGEWTLEDCAKEIRAALDALGFEIREKNDD